MQCIPRTAITFDNVHFPRLLEQPDRYIAVTTDECVYIRWAVRAPAPAGIDLSPETAASVPLLRSDIIGIYRNVPQGKNNIRGV